MLPCSWCYHHILKYTRTLIARTHDRPRPCAHVLKVELTQTNGWTDWLVTINYDLGHKFYMIRCPFASFVVFFNSYLELSDTRCRRIFLYFCKCIVVVLASLSVWITRRFRDVGLGCIVFCCCFYFVLCISPPPCFVKMLLAVELMWIVGPRAIL